MLVPMIQEVSPHRTTQTLMTADAGYFSDTNIQYLKDKNIPGLIADNQIHKLDDRLLGQQKHKTQRDPLHEKSGRYEAKPMKVFRPLDFSFNDDNTATCLPVKTMTSLVGFTPARTALTINSTPLRQATAEPA
jgi:hypothetical protein